MSDHKIVGGCCTFAAILEVHYVVDHQVVITFSINR